MAQRLGWKVPTGWIDQSFARCVSYDLAMKTLFIVSAILFTAFSVLSIGGNLLVGIVAAVASLSSLAGFFVVRSRGAKA